jgi:hypothetical protein
VREGRGASFRTDERRFPMRDRPANPGSVSRSGALFGRSRCHVGRSGSYRDRYLIRYLGSEPNERKNAGPGDPMPVTMS